jgi:hypothetical protein
MVDRVLRKLLLFVSLSILTSAMASGQVPKSAQNNSGADFAFGPKVLFTNLSGTHHGYDFTTGYFVDGASFNNQVLAMGFTPSQDATFFDAVIPAAVYTENGGASQGRMNLFLYTDAGGAPGSAIDGPLYPSKHLYNFDDGRGGGLVLFACHTCPAVSAGTPYWIVAWEKAADVQLTWDFSNTDLSSPFDFNQTGSLTGPWTAQASGTARPALEVDGN